MLLSDGRAMATGEVMPRTEDPEAVKTEWLCRLDALVDDVEGWANRTRNRQYAILDGMSVNG